MPRGTATKPSQNDNHTIILPISQEQYDKILLAPKKMRAWIDEMYRQHPEIFPVGFECGYTLHDIRTSVKLGIQIRRITLRDDNHWTIQPSFVMPYMTGLTTDVQNALLLRKWSVPYWALAMIFGRDDNYWYRIETQFGDYSIVATTVKTVDIPTNLLADEHHTWINGEKAYIATTVGGGCILGAEVCEGASTDELKKGYGVYKAEALAVDPEYAPETVNTDGWAGTIGAWNALFVHVVLIRCFLHAWIRIRERSKHLKEKFFELGGKVWDVYYSTTRRTMSQRIRRLRDWSTKNLSGVVLEKVLDLCEKVGEWSLWYDHKEAHATSNALDRLMRSQNKYFERGQHFHGGVEASNKRSRSWAILHNYWDWCPASVSKNEESRCPAERLNGKRYCTSWLENLLVATSAVPKTKRPPQKTG